MLVNPRMSSIIDQACDRCGTVALSALYTPIGTRRGVQVALCQQCGLVQSIQTISTPSERIQSLSCDADWGNVRHGKGARLNSAITFISDHVVWPHLRRVLDVGANRGDFVLWIAEHSSNAEIIAVEPDVNVLNAYREVPRINTIVGRFETVELIAPFDFIYCSHTLEHAQSSRKMLERLRDLLGDQGLLYLEVPALEAISKSGIVEEYFIDKHTFHFDRKGLREWVSELGLCVVAENDSHDLYNITLLLKRGEQHPSFCNSERVEHNRKLIHNYLKQLEANRKILKYMVEQQLRPLATRQRVAYFGAGRIFDALVKYGGLDPHSVHVLVDSYLHGKVPEIHGLPIEKPAALKQFEPQVCVVLGRSAEDQMRAVAIRHGIRHVITFSELFEQLN